MNEPDGEWTGGCTRGTGSDGAEGLRERKKRQTRQQLSDTATRMFLEYGFDAVRVADVAAQCGVSEKTVYNYFPNKESLILDRWDSTLAAVQSALGRAGVAPVDAALHVLDVELCGFVSTMGMHHDTATAVVAFQRFGSLVRTTLALQAHQYLQTDRLLTLIAAILAERTRKQGDDPEPRMAAIALGGLWAVQHQALRKYVDGTRTAADIYEAVRADVRCAAELIERGLAQFQC